MNKIKNPSTSHVKKRETKKRGKKTRKRKRKNRVIRISPGSLDA
jgi:hypothetical protein